MALPPIILAQDEPIRLISPDDDSICRDATPAEFLEQYVSGAEPDPTTLVIDEDAAPVWFTVRALNPREMRVWRSRVPQEVADNPLADFVLWCEVASRFLQLGLVSVENWPGWSSVSKVDLYGLKVWPMDAVAQIPEATLLWLGKVIMRLSTLDGESKKNSGSSAGNTDGTSAAETQKGAEKAPGHLTPVATVERSAAAG